MARKPLIHVLGFPDGRFLDQGFDCADRFVTNPWDATHITLFESERDTNEYRDQGAIVVEYEIKLTPTGRTCADIFKEERAQIAASEEELRLAKEELDRAERAKEEESTRSLAAMIGIDYPIAAPSTREGE